MPDAVTKDFTVFRRDGTLYIFDEKTGIGIRLTGEGSVKSSEGTAFPVHAATVDVEGFENIINLDPQHFRRSFFPYAEG